MKNRKSFLALLLVTLAIMCATATAAGFKFRYHDVNVSGATETDTYANNKHNAITGDYLDSQAVMHGMILEGSKLTTIDDPNGTGTQGFGISNSGVVVGWYTNNNTGAITGFIYKGGKFTDIAPAGSLETEATGINSKGAVVGLYIDANGAQHGFVTHNLTTFKKLDIKGAATTAAWGINDAGLITVYSQDDSGNYTSWTTADKGKHYTGVNYPKAGPLGTVIHTPNNNGEIVGTYFDANNGGHGWFFSGGKYYKFNDPKASNSTRGDGLSDTERVTGRYTPATGGNFGFEARVLPK